MAAGDTGHPETDSQPIAGPSSAEDDRPAATPTTRMPLLDAGHPARRKNWAFHDPTAGLGGVVPTRTARLWLAAVGLALCIAAMLASFELGMTWAGVLLAALSAATVVNIGWVAHRRRRT